MTPPKIMNEKEFRNLMDSKIRSQYLPHPALALGYKPKKKFKDLEERIENALNVMADIIRSEGERYLPIFIHLENELGKHRSNKAALQRALLLADKNEI